MRPIQGGGSEPFLTYTLLRGQQQALIDLVDNPELVHFCLDRLFGFCYENTRRIYEQIPGQVLISYVAEDMGSQRSLLYSPAHIREFLIPRMKRMIDLVHQAGAFVFHHNDGAIRKIVPDMIDAGIDVLNPVQWRCAGMEREGLKRDFGDDADLPRRRGQPADAGLRLDGGGAPGGPRQFPDPRGRRRVYTGPVSQLQAISPPENIVAMYETGYQ